MHGDTSSPGIFRLGSRGSDLALWQSRHIGQMLKTAWPNLQVEIEVFSTKGDQILDTPLPLIGGKGLFTAELEAALRRGQIDAAVHSLKDLPTESPAGLVVGAIPARANPADTLISRHGYTVATLPSGATVGTSSHRRAAQLLHQRPDLNIADLRGNVPTRIQKALDPSGPYDAIILAYAGLERLGRLDAISQVLSPEQMLPAPGQGAMGVQCRDEGASLEILALLDDGKTRYSVTAERSFLNALGGGCSVPVAAFALVELGQVTLHGRVSPLDGSPPIEVQGSRPQAEAPVLGEDLAQQALSQGAGDLLGDPA
jgi:hydroxymethylbilane synthase